MKNSYLRDGLRFWLCLLATLVLIAPNGMAQTPPPDAGAPQMTAEQKVLSKMHQANAMEMKMGEMAKEKGSSEKIKAFGNRLFLDHRMGDKKVTDLAAALGIELVQVPPQTPEETQQAQMQMQMQEQLQQAQGQEFDQKFARAMQKAHAQVIQNLQQALGMLKGPQVVSLVKHLLPILEQHETIAQHLSESQSSGK